MTKDIPQNILKELSRLITIHTGLYFPEKKWNTLNKGLKFAIKDLDTDITQLFQSLCTAPSKKILDAITTRLTIGETYFLRDKNFFQILQDHICNRRRTLLSGHINRSDVRAVARLECYHHRVGYQSRRVE
jgi:chemotaxis protein methyltransferase CheR